MASFLQLRIKKYCIFEGLSECLGENGMIHLYTGDGKGKTTAAVGMAVRAAGHGMRVLFCQFMKDGSSGELTVLKKIKVQVYCSPPMKKLTFQMQKDEFDSACHDMREAASEALKLMEKLWPDMIILDELATALGCGMISPETARELIAKCGQTELVITGRNAPDWLREAADYVSVIECVRHPYQSGTPGRAGIEW